MIIFLVRIECLILSSPLIYVYFRSKVVKMICKDFSKKVASIFIVLMCKFKLSLTVGDDESHV